MVKKSSSPPKEQQQEPLAATAPVVADKVAATNMHVNKETKSMSDTPSIIEYTDDLADAEAPVPLPAGDYPAEVRGAERKTSGKGNEYVNVTFFISPDEYPADYVDGNPDGTILSFGRLSPANEVRARFGMKKFAEAIGATLGKSLDLNDWIGKTAIVTVANGEYEGVPNANITKVNPV